MSRERCRTDEYYSKRFKMCVTDKVPPKELIEEWFEKAFQKSPQTDPYYFEELIRRFEKGEDKAVAQMDFTRLAEWKKIRPKWRG